MTCLRFVARLIVVGFSTLLTHGFLCGETHAQTPKRTVPKRSLVQDSLVNDSTREFQFGLRDSLYTELYDPLTIARLRRMQDEAKPQVGRDDYDADKTRDVAESAFAIQSGKTFVKVISKSDLRNVYQDVKRGFERVQSVFRYSVQSTGESMTFTRKRTGTRWLEFNVEFSPRTVLEPQLRIADVVRFRYDYSEQRPMLEYQFAF